MRPVGFANEVIRIALGNLPRAEDDICADRLANHIAVAVVGARGLSPGRKLILFELDRTITLDGSRPVT